MSLHDDVIDFLGDLIQGDFADDPSSASIIVNGAIGLIPVVDQLLDVRDITGVVYKNTQKGWGNLAPDDYANLSFAAIGVIPEFGSFFKGAVKPLWRNRKTAGRGVANSMAMLERALGMKKGGVLSFIKNINWPQRTQEAVNQANNAIDVFSQMLEQIAAGGILIPDSLEDHAKQTLPSIRQAKQHIKTAIERGSKLIEEFLKDMLGERAEWATAAVNVAMAASTSGSSHHAKSSAKGSQGANAKRGQGASGQNKQSSSTAAGGAQEKKAPVAKKTESDKSKPTSSATNDATLKDEPKVIGSRKEQNASGGETAVLHTQEKIRKDMERLAKYPMALVAEHMVDYHVLEQHGGKHPHGDIAGKTTGPLIFVNEPKRPKELILEDLARVNAHGIDTLWKFKDREHYLVVEAKGRLSGPSTSAASPSGAISKSVKNQKKNKTESDDSESAYPKIPDKHGLKPEEVQLWKLLPNTSAGPKAQYGGAMQMSEKWIEVNLLDDIGTIKVTYDPVVYLVNRYPSSNNGAEEHCASVEASLGTYNNNNDEHKATHEITQYYDKKNIAAVELLRRKVHEANKQSKVSKSTDEIDKNQKPKRKRKTSK